MQIEATLARIETLHSIIEALSEEYNSILDDVAEEYDFVTSAIERGIVIESHEEQLSDQEKMLDSMNSMMYILNNFDTM